MLKEYMYENDITQKELARRLGCSAPHLCLILGNKKKPSERIQYKIDQLLKSHPGKKTRTKNED